MEPRHIVSVVQRFLSADLVRQHGVVCKFDIIGEGGGVFNLDLKMWDFCYVLLYQAIKMIFTNKTV